MLLHLRRVLEQAQLAPVQFLLGSSKKLLTMPVLA